MGLSDTGKVAPVSGYLRIFVALSVREQPGAALTCCNNREEKREASTCILLFCSILLTHRTQESGNFSKKQHYSAAI